MPEKEVLERARQDKREGKAPSTQAGEFVREEIEHIREGKHGARSAKQAIAIGLSKARRAGVKLPPPEKGSASEETREQAARDLSKGKSPRKKISAKRSRAMSRVLKREGSSAASRRHSRVTLEARPQSVQPLLARVQRRKRPGHGRNSSNVVTTNQGRDIKDA